MNRRTFLGACLGGLALAASPSLIAATGSALAAFRLAAAEKERPASVTSLASHPLAIDCQSHLFSTDMLALMEKHTTARVPASWRFLEVERQVRF